MTGHSKHSPPPPPQPPQPQPQPPSTIHNLVLAGIASMTAAAITHPIDTLKVSLQNSISQTSLYKCFRRHSVNSLYKGLSAALLREASYSTLRLGLYQPYKGLLGHPDKYNSPLWCKLAAGLLSGSTGSIISTPLDLIKVRQQSSGSSCTISVLSHFQQIYQVGGVQGLWKGTLINTSRGAILTATKMATYDSVKHYLISRQWVDSYQLFFVCSLSTALVLTVVTAPLDLIKTRTMANSTLSTSQIIRNTFRNEHPTVFFRAMGPQFIRFGPFNIIQLVLWEQLKVIQGLSTL